ncbi:hypothetical protein HY095_00185 [Candidatus Micrarchaeota archaeon]|nr:hypothetical protein [Candidatus Micrarchaeota archaeon]
MPADLITEAWLVLLLSLVLSGLALPFVFVFSFVQSYFESRNPKAPRVLLMALTTFLAVLCAVALLEIYLGYTIGDLAGALAPK